MTDNKPPAAPGTARRHRWAVRGVQPDDAGTQLLDALGLRQPLRVAVRAAAQSLAAALDDGASDDEGGVAAGPHNDRLTLDDEGNRRVVVTLGEDPYILLRLQGPVVEDSPIHGATIISGGPWCEAPIRQDEVLEIALGAVRQEFSSREGGEGGNTAAFPDSFGEFLQLLGIDPNADGVADLRRRMRARDDAGGVGSHEPGAPFASGSGPSTEAPNGLPDENDQRVGSPHLRPVRDDDADDAPSPSPSTPQGDGDGASGSSAPAGDDT